MSDDLNLSGPEKFLRSIGTTLEEVGAWLKGIGLSLIGGSESTDTTKPQPVAEDKGKKKIKGEENEQEPKETEEADGQQKSQEEALAEEKLKAEVAQLQSQVEGDMAGVQKVLDSIAETTLRQPVTEALAKLGTSLEAAMKLKSLQEQSAALASLVQEIATVKADAEKAAKESADLIVARERVSQIAMKVGTEVGEVEKVIASIAEEPMRTPEAQQLEGLKKRQEATASKADPTVQEQEYSTLLADLGKAKESAAAAKVKSDELVATRERVAQIQSQAEAALVEVGKVVDAITESALKAPETVKLEALKKRQGTTNGEIDPAKQEEGFTTLVADIEKFKGEAETAKAKSDEVQVVRERVNVLKKEIETKLGEIQKVVEGIEEVPLRGPSTEALAKLNTSLESALKLVKPEEQETALIALGKEITPVRAAADKAALESAELVAQRQRVAELKAKVEKELEALEIIVNDTEGNEWKTKFKALQEDYAKVPGLPTLAKQEIEYPKISLGIAALKKSGELHITNRTAYEKAFTPISGDVSKAVAAVKKGLPLPSAEVKAFAELYNAVMKEAYGQAVKKIPALKDAADAINKSVADGSQFYVEYGKIEAAYGAAAKKTKEEPEMYPAAIKDGLLIAKNKVQELVDRVDWAEATKALGGMKTAAEKVEQTYNDCRAFAEVFEAIKGDLGTADELVQSGQLPKAIEEAMELAMKAMEPVMLSRDWVEGKKCALKIKDAIVEMKKALQAGQLYYAAFGGIEADYNEACKILSNHSKALTDVVKTKFETAKSNLRSKVDAMAWNPAIQALTPAKTAALEVKQMKAASDSFWSVINPFLDRYNKAFDAAAKAGLVDPEGKDMIEANSAMMKAHDAKDWAAAESKCAALLAATIAAENVLKQPAAKAYYAEFDKILATYDKATAAIRLKADKLDLFTNRVNDAKKVAQDAAKKKAFTAATNALPPLKKAVEELVQAAEAFKIEQEKFAKKFKKITDLPAAQKIAARPPKKLEAVEAKAFREKYIPFNDARNAGDFKKATGAISALQVAIDNLVAAEAAYTSEKSAYEAELKKVTDLQPAIAVSGSGSVNPVITAKVGPFNLAKKAVDDLAAAENWTGAQVKISELKTAASELVKAEAEADAAVTPEADLEIRKKVTDLKPRTDQADEPDQPKYIDTLQKTAQGHLTGVNALIGKKEYAKAEAGIAKLVAALTATEEAKTKYAEFHEKFDKAEKGEVDKARKLVLEPAKLAKERTDALKASEKRILMLAAKGKLPKAEKDVVAWVNEAKAWKESKAAYDNLNDEGEPDPVKLKDLAKKPGGAKVLDALVGGLPEGKPEKFMKAAIGARFDIDVKRFDKRDSSRPRGLPATQLDQELPDKSLKKMYELMANLPGSNVKGPVAELIVFDESAGGASFNRGTKTVKMYCGRANDPNGSKQQFNQPGTIQPPGEEVELDFQAVDDKEVPYFDFATLHEVGHAVESNGASLMAHAGWRTHTSDQVAEKVANHFKYDLDFVKATLANPSSTPPPDVATVPSSSNPTDWAKARNAVVDWCQSVRVGNTLWEKPGVSKQVAIGGRVFQEAYEDDWVSYDVAARSKGISSYQFRSSGEWFAELYAAYFSGKLKKTHPYAPDLKKLKKP